MEGFNAYAQYNRYLSFMKTIESMDSAEAACDASAGLVGEMMLYLNRLRSTPDPEIDKDTDDDDDVANEDYFQSDGDIECEDVSDTVQLLKKKIDLDNPYRGLKDSGNPLENMSDDEFLSSYKFSKKSIFDVMELIKNDLIKQTNRGSPVPPLIELLTTVKYLTTGSVQKKAMKGVSQSTISRINTRVTKLLVTLQDKFIKFPKKSKIDVNKVKFYDKGKFPEVVGCIGSTHIGVRAKGIRNYNVGYINENGYHSVRVQLIIGPNLEILDIVSRWPGGIHQNNIFNVCDVNQRLRSGEVSGVLLGNQAYNPTPILMTSIKQPQHTGEYYYNEALSKTYVAEDCITEWKKRFRCLQTFLACKSQTQQNIIMCCAILHNVAKLNKDALPVEDEYSVVDEVKGKKDYPRRRIEIPAVEDMALIARDEFIRKNFPMYHGNTTMSYLSL